MPSSRRDAEVTERQERALEEIADRPRRLPRSTGEALARRGLATPERGCVYAITDRGRRLQERRALDNWVALLHGKLSKENRERRDRAVSWLAFVGQLTSEGRRYAKTCLTALILEVDIPPSGMGWGDDGDVLVLERARSALGAVGDVDEARRQASEQGADVVARWTVEPPRALEFTDADVSTAEERRAAVRSAEAGEGIVDLGRYREERIA
jgi:hypothetical protein